MRCKRGFEVNGEGEMRFNVCVQPGSGSLGSFLAAVSRFLSQG